MNSNFKNIIIYCLINQDNNNIKLIYLTKNS